MGPHRHATNLLRFQYISVSRIDLGDPVAKKLPVKIGKCSTVGACKSRSGQDAVAFRLAS